MNAATEFDLGTLTWVKSEIDLALERAEEALAQSAVGTDVTQVKFCRTHVHQVHGALAMVGLDGVTQITESLESVLLAIEEGRQTATETSLAVLRRALAAVRQYLDELMAGEPNQPLRLLPVHLALAEVGGTARAQASDLFFPDLSLRPPKRDAVAARLSPDELRKVLKSERMRYEKGLLNWLTRPPQAEEGRQLMLDALSRIEATQETPAARSFWWTAQAFVEALADPGVSSAEGINQVSTRIDLQIRRLLEGSSNVAERLMRTALYHVAQAPAGLRPLIAQVQSTFGLPALLPAEAADATQQPRDAVLRRLRETLASTEELWNKVCIGSLASLPGFAEHARNVATLTEEVAHTDLKRLGQGLGAIANWLSEETGRYSDTVAMEVATAILLLQNAQENFKRLGTDFAQQVDLMVARLYACIAGKPAVDTEIPLLDEMTRRAQEKLLIGQVAREIQNNLAQVEQALDAFFRDPAKGHDLSALEAPLKQIGGALAMLGHLGAVASLQTCGEHIRRFAETDYQPAQEDFEVVAGELSLLGFFVDALSSGEKDFDAFVRRLQGESETPAEDAEAEQVTVEAQLAQQALDTHALVEALRETPEDSRLHAELKQNLQAIQKDADLVADHALGETAKAALEALQTGEMANVDVDAALSGLKPQHAEAPQPSAATLQLAQSSHEEIDAELLAIFLEEAGDVLNTISQQLDLLASAPHDIEAMTTIRRSVHTLKGSGRMVGLKDLGETAWELEQTLNLWLRQDQAATTELLGMINDGYDLFADWVKQLESNSGLAPDSGALVALAVRLRSADGGTEASPPPPAAPLPSVTATPPASVPAPEMLDIAFPDVEAEASSFELELPFLVEPEPLLEMAPEPLPAAREAAGSELLAAAEPETLVPLSESDVLPPTVTASPTLYDIFREEARGYLQTLLDSYTQLESQPGSPTTFEMTRAAHTLGGIAATVGLMPLNHLAITLEHALLRRDGAAQPDSIEGLETVRQSIMTLEQMFVALAEQQTPIEQPQLIAALEDIFLHPPLAETPSPVSAEIIALPGVAALSETIPDAGPSLPQLTDEIDEQLLPIFLEEAADQLRDLTVQLRAWKTDLGSAVPPHAIARLLHTFKGNARMAGAMNLGELTHLLETRVQDVVRAGAPTVAFIDEIESGCDTLAQAIEGLRQGPSEALPVDAFSPQPAAPEAKPVVLAASHAEEAEAEAGGQRATLRVRADLIDRLVNDAGELSIARARIEGEMRSLKGSLLELTENVIRLRRQLREIEIQAEGQIQARVAQTPEGEAQFDPLELDRFTRFQELTRFMAESVNDVATVQQNLLKNLDDANAAILAQSRLNRGLQQDLMGVRMIPFASQAERLYRIVRQTAKDVDKRANLDIVGGQVEMDRSVLDKMLAPLEHMLRNAVTHGIERQAERLAAGKREVGEITVALAQEGNEIVLTMADDGKGLDAARIRARAESLGLLQPGQAIEAAALYDFIFQPGFSTAEELTQVAGRGVGMDVVKTEVGALGGRIEILSQAGRGTTFRLYLPLTLAVTQTLLIRAGTQLYAVPSTMIEQVQELKEKSLAVLREKGVAEWQNNSYPLYFLPHLLGDSEAVPEVRRRYWVLLLRSGSQRVAIQIDELKGNQEVVVKNIGAQLARVVGIAGATVLADGQVVLILNPVALASRLPAIGVAPATPLGAAPEVASLPTVMVVDDSLTVRKITSRLLNREGYEVVLAKDGVDALEQLIDVMPDVVLSDIEMPRMDGFDLLRNIRADDRLKHLPVIMITSRTADKHRNYAAEIGADHYLGKPYDEEKLLGLIAGYIKAKAGN
ncbi:MAG: Response regulator receiver:CheW-like protein:ATP-binding region, ATPase-like:Hpt [Proteobacteria bacterium]|nr:Response regulator receiver:CheW-like protein:ATP-binding region, ATPase-like:Hpt [Pseudomonadota bacterium]